MQESSCEDGTHGLSVSLLSEVKESGTGRRTRKETTHKKW